MIYVAGPGHGGPGIVANTYLEGTYSEIYPNIPRNADGMQRLFRQFSFPGGIPSHVAPETPGSIHEGGELGYSLLHAYGAAFDNPDLMVCCVVGDGEAETGPLATSWHSNKFLNPARDGAVLPVLHLNGYKIAGPTVLARIPRKELNELPGRLRLQPYYRGRRRSRGDAPGDGRARSTRSWKRSGRSRARRDRKRLFQAARMAHDRAADSQGLDRPQDSGRRAGRGHVPRAPGADRGNGLEAGAHPDARRVDAELSSRGVVRRRRNLDSGARRTGPAGRPPHGRESARQRRSAAQRPDAARFPRLRRGGPAARRGHCGSHARYGPVPARRHEAEPAVRAISASWARTRQPPTAWTPSSR